MKTHAVVALLAIVGSQLVACGSESPSEDNPADDGATAHGGSPPEDDGAGQPEISPAPSQEPPVRTPRRYPFTGNICSCPLPESREDEANLIAVTPLGNVLFSANAAVPGSASQVAKVLKRAGNPAESWGRTFGTVHAPGWVRFDALLSDALGSPLLLGVTDGEVDDGSGAMARGSFILKLTYRGDPEWLYQSPAAERIEALATPADRSVHAAVIGTDDLGTPALLVLSLSPSGQVQRRSLAARLRSGAFRAPATLAVDDAGGVFVATTFTGEFESAGQVFSSATDATVVIALGPEGSVSWARMPFSRPARVDRIALSATQVFLAGEVEGAAEFAGRRHDSALPRPFVLAYGRDGTARWWRPLEAVSARATIAFLDVDHLEQPVLAGSFRSIDGTRSAQLNAGGGWLSSKAFISAGFVARLTGEGNHRQSRAISEASHPFDRPSRAPITGASLYPERDIIFTGKRMGPNGPGPSYWEQMPLSNTGQ
jgi:hypothetical protein